MKYAIQVHPKHNWQISQHLAKNICEAMLAQGDEILAVFFYGSATQIASKFNQHDWMHWDTNKSPLLVCSSLTEKMNVQHAQDSAFTITGMASWMHLLEQSDHLITIP